MNVKFIALLMSLFVITIPVHAEKNNPSHPSANLAVASNKINLNKADLATLTGSFKGIGKKRAAAIIAYRESHHGFKSLDELAEIKGFGQHFLEVNREKLKDVFVIK